MTDEAAFFVENDEELIRECSSGNIRGDGSVKPRAFVATKDPLEISVHRENYCDDVCRDRSKAAVRVIAGEARQLESKPVVKSEPPPIDHALICVAEAPAVRTKEELSISANAVAFAKHDALCRELASIATVCERIFPSPLAS